MTEKKKTVQKTVQKTARKTAQETLHKTGRWLWDHKGPLLGIGIGVVLGGWSLNSIVRQLVPK